MNSKDPAVPAERTQADGRVNSITKALRILDCFTPERTELSLSQLSRLLGMPKSTLLNQVRTLESSGYLMKTHDTQAYRLGFKIMELSYCAHAAMPVIQYAIPLMEELQAATGENIYLTSYLDGRVFYLECMYPSRRSVAYSVSGKTLPMHCTGCGKAMLSQMPAEEAEAIIDRYGLPPVTPNTITDKAVLLGKLGEYRRLGYAVDDEEETPGVRCVAMAVRSSRGEVAGALSISGSTLSVNGDNIGEYAKLLSRACNALTQYAHLFPAIQCAPVCNIG
ncbi:MAG: IclR family transcriptional regulator [Candidatus Limivicinus sp.]|nr:IclR family transcriptional regulator [Clostridiales bacterium]MDY3859219.1 IclR family transcriptional regulator [Candidatus Limivicinus sp.]